MTRFLTVGAAQMGPIQRSHTRRDVVERLIAHLREASRMGCELVVFPELTLTTFFPRWHFERQEEVDAFFEREMPGAETPVALHVFESAPEPKELLLVDGGHFGMLYHPSPLFDQASTAQAEFLVRHLG